MFNICKKKTDYAQSFADRKADLERAALIEHARRTREREEFENKEFCRPRFISYDGNTNEFFYERAFSILHADKAVEFAKLNGGTMRHQDGSRFFGGGTMNHYVVSYSTNKKEEG